MWFCFSVKKMITLQMKFIIIINWGVLQFNRLILVNKNNKLI